MTVDEIIADLKPTGTAPAAVLLAGVALADKLAAAVHPIADKFCDGVYCCRPILGSCSMDYMFSPLHGVLRCSHAPKSVQDKSRPKCARVFWQRTR
jgi:hypothetical protein